MDLVELQLEKELLVEGVLVHGLYYLLFNFLLYRKNNINSASSCAQNYIMSIYYKYNLNSSINSISIFEKKS